MQHIPKFHVNAHIDKNDEFYFFQEPLKVYKKIIFAFKVVMVSVARRSNQ